MPDKNPCINDDVRYIIKAMPETHITKPAESSLILFSLYTGARAITVSNIKIKDMFFDL